MNKLKYKVGDKIRYLGVFGHKGLSKGDITNIIDVKDNQPLLYLISCPEGTVHFIYNGTNAGWWVSEKDIEPAYKIGEQLIFNF